MLQPKAIASGVKTALLLLAAGICPATFAQAQTQIFADEFNNSAVDTAAWRVYDPAYYLQATQWGLSPTFGADADGTGYARLPIQSYNPNVNQAGKTYLGSQIFSRERWNLGTGVEFEARMRSNNLPPGLVLGFFSYGDAGEWTSTYQKTEIDYELLTTQGGNKMWLNIWDDWNPERGGPNQGTLTTTPGNWNDGSWKTYLIRWLPNKTEWLVDGQVVRTDTNVRPASPQGVCFNLWAASSGWGTAYSSAIAPTANPAQNREWSFDVDYVRVRQLPAPTPPTGNNGLDAVYYNNSNFSGSTVRRVDPTIDFTWDQGSPDSAIDPDTFSARWTGSVQAPTTGTYTFTTRTDDGVRLWVNGKQLINNWIDQGATEKSGSISLRGGSKYSIRMEYYDNTGGAVAQLMWSAPGITKQIVPQSRLFASGAAPPPPTWGNGTGLTGKYYDNANFTGTEVIRLDPRLNFSWGNFGPARGLGVDSFSVRWTGYIQPQYTQTYTFTTRTSDGVRLWINGQQLINNWVNQSATERTGTVALTAGQKYPIVMEYYDNTGDATAQLYWSSSATSKQLVPQSQLYPENIPATPAFGLAPGTYTTTKLLPISSSTSQAVIKYTLDGSDPVETSPTLANGESLRLNMPALVRARAFVNGWVMSPIISGYYNIVDSVSPVALISNPVSNPYVNALPAFTGTAADNVNGSGLSKVNIVLRRVVDNKKWNGTAWIDDEYGLRCTLNGTAWAPSDPLPAGANLLDGNYAVKAVAFDFAGNTGVAQQTFRLERVAPSVAITLPANGSTIPGLTQIRGTASDNWSGVSRVGITIRRLSDNKRWSGFDWVDQEVGLPTSFASGVFTAQNPLSNGGNLPSGINLPAGSYQIKAVGYDVAGNIGVSTIQVTVGAGGTILKSVEQS